MIELKKITKAYGEKVILDKLNLKVETGEYISITGDSGAGKSTLLNIIGTLDYEYSGEYVYNEKVLKRKKEFNIHRNKEIGFIFQQYNLIPNLSAYENIILPYTFFKGRIADIDKIIDNNLVRFNMKDKKHQVVNTLSGGEQQRIALLRSILLDPNIIVADEPTGNLDRNNAAIILDFLSEMNDLGKTIIVVTHDIEFSKQAKKSYMIAGGKLHEV